MMESNGKSDNKDKSFTENTPLYPLMTKVCHVLMFLYGGAYWIQIGVFPVSFIRIYIKQYKDANCMMHSSNTTVHLAVIIKGIDIPSDIPYHYTYIPYFLVYHHIL